MHLFALGESADLQEERFVLHKPYLHPMHNVQGKGMNLHSDNTFKETDSN